MVDFKEIKFSCKVNDDPDVLFKFARKISVETDEELNSSTFITAEDALISKKSIFLIKNFPKEDSEILRDFIQR